MADAIRGAWAAVQGTSLHAADGDGRLLVAGVALLLAARRQVGAEEQKMRDQVFAAALAALVSLHSKVRAKLEREEASASTPVLGGAGPRLPVPGSSPPSTLALSEAFRKSVLSEMEAAHTVISDQWETRPSLSTRPGSVGATRAMSGSEGPYSEASLRYAEEVWAQFEVRGPVPAEGAPAGMRAVLERGLFLLLDRARVATDSSKGLEAAEWQAVLCL